MALHIADVEDENRYSGANALLWVDLETTGGRENIDAIIEIGAIVTDFQFEQQGDAFSAVVDPDEYSLGRLMKNRIVREMHQENGLLEDILNGKGVPIEETERQMISWLNAVMNRKTRKGPIEKYRFMLAGSGVSHFDRRFLTMQMPALERLLIFPPLDVGIVRRFLKFSGVEPSANNTADKDHRALGDIRLHLEEARGYKKLVQSLVLS